MLNNFLLSVKSKTAALLVPLALLSLALNGLTTSASRIEPTAAGLGMAFAQSAGAARQDTPMTLKSPEAYARVWHSVVTLVGEKADGQKVLIGGGFFVDEWTIVTNYYLVKGALDNQVRAIAGLSLDGKAKYTVINLLTDADHKLLFLGVRQKGPQPLPLNTDVKIKIGDKAYLAGPSPVASLGRLGRIDAIPVGAGPDLQEAAAPIPPEYSGQPALDQAGRVIGVAVDPGIKGAPANGVLPAKHLSEQLEKYLNYVSDPDSKKGSGAPERAPATGAADSPAAEREVGGQSALQPNAPSRVVAAAPGTVPSVLQVSSGVLQGKALRRVTPFYPAFAKAARVSGSVKVQIVINEQGEVTEAETVSGHPMLHLPSLRAARQWKFAPSLLEDRPVKVQGDVTFNFTLQ
jgi:TonB family protein